MAVSQSEGVFVSLPDPGRAGTLDELVEQLRRLKVWAGAPSYDTITGRINATWTAAGRPGGELAGRTTVADCFRPGRRRLNTDLVVAVVQALHPDSGYVAQWRQALQVITGQAQAAALVRVQDRLPPELAGFTGRTAELDQLYLALRHGIMGGGAVVVSAIAGMAGVGKTQLAVHAAHQLGRDELVERVLFVNLRGFDPDPGQPPADPAAVLDGFLRLLGMPGQQITHELSARIAAYRDRLAGTRTLIVLDNAATVEQIRPLLPDVPGCPVLVTSRHSLAALHPATHVTVDVFTPDEALAFLARNTNGVPVGPDPEAASRIASRCGHLPLALNLVTAHIQAKPGWTMTDSADRLDERHHQRRLDSGVELALALSYQQLPSDGQRLLRLLALHPGQDVDPYAAAALADTDLPTAQARLGRLRADHLLQQHTPGRYTYHDLVRSYATGRAGDEDSPRERRAALTRLFDYYLATTAAAVSTLYPAETHRRPSIPPVGTPTPQLADPEAARAWLDTERPTLVAVAVHSAAHGWLTHTTRLSTVLLRYLQIGHFADALTIHGRAHHAARQTGDPLGQAHVLLNLGGTELMIGRSVSAADHLEQALRLFRLAGDRICEARTLVNLGGVEMELGRYQQAAEHRGKALHLYRLAGDRTGEARALLGLGNVDIRLGRYRPAADHIQQALALYLQDGNQDGEANALNTLGEAEMRQGRYGPAVDSYERALTLYRKAGDRDGVARVLESLGSLYTRLDQPAVATDHYQQALAIVRETGDRATETWALNGLGEAAQAAGNPTDAVTYYTAANSLAADIDSRDQRARAQTGLGHAHHSLGDLPRARHHYQQALVLYTDLGTPEADQVRAHLAGIDDRMPAS